VADTGRGGLDVELCYSTVPNNIISPTQYEFSMTTEAKIYAPSWLTDTCIFPTLFRSSSTIG